MGKGAWLFLKRWGGLTLNGGVRVIVYISETYHGICTCYVIIYIHRFAAVSDVPLNISGNPPTLVPAEDPLLQPAVLDKLLLRRLTLPPAFGRMPA